MNTATVTADGLAVLELDTQRHQLHADSVAAARKQAVALAIDHARTTGQPLTLLARDPGAEHLLEILPDGTVRPAPAEAIPSPFAPPTDGDPHDEHPPITAAAPTDPAVEVPPTDLAVEVLPVRPCQPSGADTSHAARSHRRGGGVLAAGAALTLAVGAAASLALWQPWHTTTRTALTQPSAAAAPGAAIPAQAVSAAVPATSTGLTIPAVTVRPARWATATEWEARRQAREQARIQARNARQWSPPVVVTQPAAPAGPAYQPPAASTASQPAARPPAYQPPTRPAPAPAAKQPQPSVRIYPDPQINPDTP